MCKRYFYINYKTPNNTISTALSVTGGRFFSKAQANANVVATNPELKLTPADICITNIFEFGCEADYNDFMGE